MVNRILKSIAIDELKRTEKCYQILGKSLGYTWSNSGISVPCCTMGISWMMIQMYVIGWSVHIFDLGVWKSQTEPRNSLIANVQVIMNIICRLLVHWRYDFKANNHLSHWIHDWDKLSSYLSIKIIYHISFKTSELIFTKTESML